MLLYTTSEYYILVSPWTKSNMTSKTYSEWNIFCQPPVHTARSPKSHVMSYFYLKYYYPFGVSAREGEWSILLLFGASLLCDVAWWCVFC